jgi:hypothetical protein
MDIAGFLALLEASNLAGRIRNSLYIFPLIESFHVIGLTMVFGMIAIIDLRLLGVASTRRPFMRIRSEVMKWIWAAFALTAATGLLMFITNAVVYYHNFNFRFKMALLALAGINMLVFELTAGRTVHRWNKDTAAPLAGRAAAALSLVIWISVIFMGRWIGFTTARSAPQINDTDNINFDDLFPPSPDDGDPR